MEYSYSGRSWGAMRQKALASERTVHHTLGVSETVNGGKSLV